MIHTIKSGETLWSIAEDYRITIQSLLAANPTINPNLIYAGQPLVIPGFPPVESLPYAIRVDLSERTLTLLHHGQIHTVFPIAVGRVLHETPVGDFIIINKAPNPGGPYGTMWMSLSKKHYGIHGTNNPSSIGNYVSRGCIRMYNEDVEKLASIIPIGTPVAIRP